MKNYEKLDFYRFDSSDIVEHFVLLKSDEKYNILIKNSIYRKETNDFSLIEKYISERLCAFSPSKVDWYDTIEEAINNF
jgi:hypothetical protein